MGLTATRLPDGTRLFVFSVRGLNEYMGGGRLCTVHLLFLHGNGTLLHG